MEVVKNYNPALLRLELLSQGMKLDPQLVSQLGDSLKEPLWTRTGPTSTGMDLRLERGHYVSPPIAGDWWPYHYKDSPFVLTLYDGESVVAKNGKIIQRVEPARRPSYYGRETSDGVPMTKVAVVTGDFLAIAFDNRCWFWGYYREDELVHSREKQCKYCGIGLSLHRDEIYRKSIPQILEVTQAAIEGNDIKHIGLNAGAFPPPGRGHEEYAEVVAAIKSRFDIWVRLSIAPPEEEKYVGLLFEAGADQIGYDYEVFDPELYRQICPGKCEEIDKGKPRQHYDRILSYSVQKGGPNRTYTIFVVGMEPRESTVAGVEKMCKMGVVPRMGVFRPIPGTPFEKHPTLKPEDLVYIYRKARELMLKYGVDSGCPGCGRTFIATKEYDGTNPAMPEITDEDLVRAGIDTAFC